MKTISGFANRIGLCSRKEMNWITMVFIWTFKEYWEEGLIFYWFSSWWVCALRLEFGIFSANLKFIIENELCIHVAKLIWIEIVVMHVNDYMVEVFSKWELLLWISIPQLVWEDHISTWCVLSHGIIPGFIIVFKVV